jgi:exosortase/archaeosortase family protein
MPSNKPAENINHHPQNIILYVAAATIIILVVFYVPNYFFLEKAIAHHTAFLLNSLGIHVETKIVGADVFLDDIKIVKDCTGIQVIAVFSGLLLPVPNATWKKKILTLSIISSVLYAANLLRIALEFSLVYFEIMPWFLAHYPLSLLLGITGVFILVIFVDHLIPEFKDFLFNFIHPGIP